MSLTTAHRQVTASIGVDVDEGIRDLLEALWSRGMVTEFSCQGDHGQLAHICFARAADAYRFIEAPGEFLITVGESRVWVDFPAHLIVELTRHWSTRCRSSRLGERSQLDAVGDQSVADYSGDLHRAG